MATRLFAERFLIEPEEIPVPESVFDEERGYAVGEDGRPIVEVASAGQTHTVTEVRSEEPDSDPAPGTQTWTFVEAEGADVSFLAATETDTRVRGEAPDEALARAPGQETFTKIKAEGRDEASLRLESLARRRLQAATMTKTAVQDLKDQDTDS